MDTKQIKRFVDKVRTSDVPDLPELEICIEDHDRSELACANHCFKLVSGKYVEMKRELILRKSALKLRYTNANRHRDLKSTLLHEVGHFATGRFKRSYFFTECRYKREMKAHLWAIDRAKELGMTDVAKHLVYILKNWQYYAWNGENRVFRMAYSEIMADKKLVKKYGLNV